MIFLFLLECYELERRLYKHYSTVVRDTATVSSVRECAGNCHRQTYCNTFSYRSRGSNNCQLSSLNSQDILVNTVSSGKTRSFQVPTWFPSYKNNCAQQIYFLVPCFKSCHIVLYTLSNHHENFTDCDPTLGSKSVVLCNKSISTYSRLIDV